MVADNRINSSNFPNSKKYLFDKYQELKNNIEELKFYNRNRAFADVFFDFYNCFLRGGTYLAGESSYTNETDDFHIAMEKGKNVDSVSTEVSYSSIPYQDREKNNIITP